MTKPASMKACFNKKEKKKKKKKKKRKLANFFFKIRKKKKKKRVKFCVYLRSIIQFDGSVSKKNNLTALTARLLKPFLASLPEFKPKP